MAKTQNLSNFYIVHPGHRLKFNQKVYSGDSDDNVFECLDSKTLVSQVKAGVCTRLDKYVEAQKAAAENEIKKAEAAAQAANQRIEAAKEQVSEVQKSLKDLVASKTPIEETAEPTPKRKPPLKTSLPKKK